MPNWPSTSVYSALDRYSLLTSSWHALGRPDDLFTDEAIQFKPVFGLLIQSIMATEGITNQAGSFIATRLTGTADLLVHHIHAFTIHVTALILVKGVTALA
jgi:photosystem I P700 chlorophyll a apoprotein A1